MALALTDLDTATAVARDRRQEPDSNRRLDSEPDVGRMTVDWVGSFYDGAAVGDSKAGTLGGLPLNQTEFETMLADRSKRIQGDIAWSEDDDHSPSVEFRAEVQSDPGYPIFVRGSYNRILGTLSYALIHRGSGRVYALDMGKDHHNPDCQHVGERHKHRWNESLRDKEAYVPQDIRAAADEPVVVWNEFCAEASVQHVGTLQAPPAEQLRLL
jgi:hypothetical protein